MKHTILHEGSCGHLPFEKLVILQCGGRYFQLLSDQINDLVLYSLLHFSRIHDSWFEIVPTIQMGVIKEDVWEELRDKMLEELLPVAIQLLDGNP